MRHKKTFWADESGPTAVEYAILLAMICVVCLGSFLAFGTKLWSMYVMIRDAVEPV